MRYATRRTRLDRQRGPGIRKALAPWQGIVKVQRALGGADSLLVYNEDRTLYVQLFAADCAPEQWQGYCDLFKGIEHRPKIYTTARCDEKGALLLLERVDDQPW